MSPLSRRDLLIGGGSALVGAGIAGTAIAVSANRPTASPSPTPPDLFTVDEWIRSRQAPYFIGHRGAGGVLPEHSMPSYTKALEWGAQCIEVSVVMSSDNVLFCLHDLTLDRTTTLKGTASKLTAAAMGLGRVSIPRLGPRWQGANMPPIPRLEDVFTELGGRAVLCIEPKDDAAYPLLIELIEKHGLKDTVVLKLDHSSPRIAMAKKAGYPVFAYLGNAQVATESAVKQLASRLDPRRDVMVLPTRDNLQLLPPKIFQTAVGTGVPVWVFPVHRRYEVDYFSLIGVQGMVAACNGYVARTIPVLKADDWGASQLTPGELTRNPYSNAFSLQWPEVGVLEIPTPGRQAFVAFGQFSPIDSASYRIAFDVSFDPMPSDTWQHVSIAFGHADDRYYEHRLGDADGYHALLRADGSMGLYAHIEGDQNGQQLVEPAKSSPMKQSVWARMTLDVTPDEIHWTRDDGTILSARNSRFRGGYFHIGSSANDGAIRLRGLAIT